MDQAMSIYLGVPPTILIANAWRQMIELPVEFPTKFGLTVSFYEEAEAALAKTPRHGMPVVLKPARGKKPAEPYRLHSCRKIVSNCEINLVFHRRSRSTLPARRHD
jgi:hypothetical protein